MNRALVDTYRGACLHTGSRDAVTGNALREVGYGRFCDTTSSHHLPSNVHQTVEEGACCDHHTSRIEFCAPDGAHADGSDSGVPVIVVLSSLFYEQFIGLVLPDVEIFGFIEMPAPFPDELPTVALGTGAPHGGSLSYVEHTELDGGGICHQSHLSAECIDLTHDLTFGNAADGRVARHLCNFVHVHGYQTGLGSYIGTGTGRLTARMPSSDHQNIILEFHLLFPNFPQK